MSPAKCGRKSWISVPMFSFTTATRGTPSSSSWGFREDSSEASCRWEQRAVTRVNAGEIDNCFTVGVVEHRSLLYLSAQKSSRPPHRHDDRPVGLPQGLGFDHHVFYEAETRRINAKSDSFFLHLKLKKWSKSTWLICCICCARIRIEQECGSSAVRPSRQSNLHYWQI